MRSTGHKVILTCHATHCYMEVFNISAQGALFAILLRYNLHQARTEIVLYMLRSLLVIIRGLRTFGYIHINNPNTLLTQIPLQQMRKKLCL